MQLRAAGPASARTHRSGEASLSRALMISPRGSASLEGRRLSSSACRRGGSGSWERQRQQGLAAAEACVEGSSELDGQPAWGWCQK